MATRRHRLAEQQGGGSAPGAARLDALWLAVAFLAVGSLMLLAALSWTRSG